jgi:nucleoside permease NupC
MMVMMVMMPKNEAVDQTDSLVLHEAREQALMSAVGASCVRGSDVAIGMGSDGDPLALPTEGTPDED